MILQDGAVRVPYQIVSIDLPEDSIRHLSNLGLKVGSRLELISKTKASAILMLKSSRLAFDASILSKITVSEIRDEMPSLPLSQLRPGEFAYISGIHAVGEAKRRLMDMGLTRRTKIFLRKRAPLGDPLELRLRGYELTLRKSEAQMISVVRINEKEAR
ncbi:ferrous iron transport protein A [Streptococcus chenjunshii]|uniref:Ferrous iron transport protein A n=1 Tax=Streptococcus chenjunshii TaxID=2173853 RepID=A0A372KJG6_9STRE|nr:ferrous iron transport protein A [Streptococcus chenjunshii]AXQ78224.1 ferrous iron transport protein A [Streptococcus chenjunshii]RFU50240.1 ferrous iron transport protein A [Streptococcus chenjunshii]RFU52452.1 ferrous iron transport protein A [Streptococcus chenjunshii]